MDELKQTITTKWETWSQTYIDWLNQDPILHGIISGAAVLVFFVLLFLLFKPRKQKRREDLVTLDDALSKTRSGIMGSLKQLIGTGRTIDDDFLEELQGILISADVGPKMTAELLVDVSDAYEGKKITSQDEIVNYLKEKMVSMMGDDAPTLSMNLHKPHVILIIGVNGSGKTTSIGKLAHHFISQEMSVLLGASDTFRAAAPEQLAIWAERTGADIVRQQEGADPASVAFDATEAALAREKDVLIIDTAGRLHNKDNLMKELAKLKRVVSKKIPSAPHEIWLVLDATTGQNGANQVAAFAESMGVTGLIATKLDGTAKGGVLLAIQHEHGIPVRFIGTGEGMTDFAIFDSKKFVDALFS